MIEVMRVHIAGHITRVHQLAVQILETEFPEVDLATVVWSFDPDNAELVVEWES